MSDVATVPAENNPTFDFITDVTFRSSLMSDYRELLRAMEVGAWKAVHVLAGSVVESLLIDHLIATGYEKRTEKDPLRMDLAAIISACKDEKIITDRTADLSSVVRSYRNLIHPGRMIRLKESVDRNTARIAKALVDVVAVEVGTARAGSLGFTAEQIVNKIENDSSTPSVLSHFLKETSDYERERLVKDIIPERYFQAQEYWDTIGSDVADYKKCHRQAFITLSTEAKTNVAKRFIKVLKEERGDYVTAYEDAFFRALQLEYLPANEAALAKAHILSRLEKEHSLGLLDVLEGLGPFLTVGEASGVVDALAKMIAFAAVPVKAKARDLLHLLYFETDGDVHTKVEKRVDDWIGFLGEKQLPEPKSLLEKMKIEWHSDIPF